MDSKFQNLESALLATWPLDLWRDLHVVIAVSGGADSVALLRAMAAAKDEAGGAGQLFVAHCDHHLRPESGADAAWLAELCGVLQLPLELGEADIGRAAAEQGDGLEAAARLARYEFLRQIAEKLGARFVAVAHTLDDQVETVLHRILRGTGFAGLAGIPAARPLSSSVTLIRPLLGASREQVIDFLRRIDQGYRTDASNEDLRFTRNRIRHQLLPLLRSEFNPDVDAAILRLSDQAQEIQQVVSEQAEELLRRSIAISSGNISVDGTKLLDVAMPLVRETCKLAWTAAGWPRQAMGFDEWQQLALLVTGTSRDVLNLPGNIRAERHGMSTHVSQIS